MKIALCLLVLLPLVYCASIDERFILDSFTHLPTSLSDFTKHLLDALGSDVTEAGCEAACPSVMGAVPGISIAAPFLCPAACKELQQLAG